jgi:subtilase family serine protease
MIFRTGLLVAGAAALAIVAATTLTAAGSPGVRRPQAGPSSGTADCNSVTTCYTPQQLEVAYGIQPLLRRGIDGRGETVVLPELAESRLSPPLVTDVRRDLADFDRVFHMPAPRLGVVSTFAGPKDPWLAYGEEVLDAEMVHAIAPRAALTILLVKGTSLDSADQAVAASVAVLRRGASEGGIISLSAAGEIGGEHCVTHAQLTQLDDALRVDADHHVTVVAASGDAGAAGEPCALTGAIAPPGGRKEVMLVASDPLVLSVGGTTLDASHTTGAWISETTWGLSGGGFSHLFRRPAYQNGVAGISAKRGVPDVAAAATPHTGMVIVINTGSRYMIRNGGGTSASAPIWAGIIALGDQYAKRHLGFVNPAIYRIARSPRYRQAFHDVTVGDSNTAKFPNRTITGYRAVPGWDPVTGWGSPNAEVLVPLLTRHASR